MSLTGLLLMCAACSISPVSSCKDARGVNPFEPLPSFEPIPSPVIWFAWMEAEPGCRGRVSNTGTVSVYDVRLHFWHCDSMVTVRPPGDSLGVGAAVIIDVPPKLVDGLAQCPQIWDIEWRGGITYGNPDSGRTRIEFSRWEGVIGDHAVGYAVNRTPHDADSIDVWTLTREGLRANRTDPQGAWGPEQEVRFVSLAADSEGVAVLPRIVRITWKAGCGRDSTVYESP